MNKIAIDLRRLRYFIAVCEHGGFSRAAQSVGIAQPSLTRQIKLLEKEVGLSLINRTGRGAEPTEEGRFLLSHSRHHIDGLDEAVREIRHRSVTLSGKLVLGICPTISPFFLDGIQSYMANSHPNVALTVVEAYSGDLMNLIGRGGLDLSLTYRPSAAGDFEVVDLFSEKLVLVIACPADLASRPQGLDEVSRLRLILPSKVHELRRIIDRVYRDRGILLKPDLELDSLGLVKSLIMDKSTQYATILPYYSVKREMADHLLSVFDLDDRDMQRTIAVVCHRNRTAPALAILMEHIRHQASRFKTSFGTLS